MNLNKSVERVIKWLAHKDSCCIACTLENLTGRTRSSEYFLPSLLWVLWIGTCIFCHILFFAYCIYISRGVCSFECSSVDELAEWIIQQLIHKGSQLFWIMNKSVDKLIEWTIKWFAQKDICFQSWMFLNKSGEWMVQWLIKSPTSISM